MAKPQVLTEGEITGKPNFAGLQVLRTDSLPQSSLRDASSLQQSRKAANLMVCRSAFSRLPTAQSKIEARHRCLQPATSRCESYGFRHRAAETLLKVEIPMWDFKSALPTADGKIKDFAAAPQGLRCVPSGGAEERTVAILAFL